VLIVEEWYANTPAYEAGSIKAEQDLRKWFGQCSEHLKRLAKKQEWFDELRSRRERYAAYVVSPNGMTRDPTVKALMDKGERKKSTRTKAGGGGSL
jgi:hypothetical protein